MHSNFDPLETFIRSNDLRPEPFSIFDVAPKMGQQWGIESEFRKRTEPQLTKTVNDLKDSIKIKDEEIATLRADIKKLSVNIDALTKRLNAMEQRNNLKSYDNGLTRHKRAFKSQNKGATSNLLGGAQAKDDRRRPQISTSLRN